MYTDSKCVFDTIANLSTVTEKRLLIDISVIGESYNTGELSNVAYVASKFNLANVFTKDKADPSMLRDLMNSGYLSHPINQWIIPRS